MLVVSHGSPCDEPPKEPTGSARRAGVRLFVIVLALVTSPLDGQRDIHVHMSVNVLAESFLGPRMASARVASTSIAKWIVHRRYDGASLDPLAGRLRSGAAFLAAAISRADRSARIVGRLRVPVHATRSAVPGLRSPGCGASCG